MEDRTTATAQQPTPSGLPRGAASPTPRWVSGYWGKARPGEGDAVRWHPLAYHCLDVAACADALLAARPSWRAALLRPFGHGADPAGARTLLLRLAAAHDVGKFSVFQALAPEARALVGYPEPPPGAPRATGARRHDNLGLAMLLGDPAARVPGLLAAVLSGAPQGLIREERELMASASACHHGRPTEGAVRLADGTTVPPAALADARAFVEACAAELFPDAPALPDEEAGFRRASLVLAAMVNVADWLGSDRGRFRYAPPTHDLAGYWGIARGRAERAVAEAGLREASSASGVGASASATGGGRSFGALYPAIRDPSPLQRLLGGELTLPERGPLLAVVEEGTGAGKTEAATALAARMVAAGLAGGVFLGLPTTATADAQGERAREVRARLFGDGSDPTFVVAHSLADGGVVGGGESASQWLADDRRRRLLADVCVGTVDQALLAALPAKYAAVRVAGLLGKVLVVDEAHAYDPYTRTLLRSLLELHGALGGPAVLLSATMPRALKADLARAYAAAAGLPAPGDAALAEEGYPLVTVVSGGGIEVHRPGAAPNAPPDRAVRLAASEAEAEEALLGAARAGRCAAWVRVTVDQAVESALSLSRRHGDVLALHSRMAEADRSRATAEVVRRFGPASGAAERGGGVLVATAVVEQSLDLDFDLVVVDLKPVEAVVQTLGRARRHRRDARGDRLPPASPPPPDGRLDEPMLVLSPDPTGDGADVAADWYPSLLGRAAFVHRDPGLLWRSARALAAAGAVRYAGMRALVEAAHGSDECPEALADASSTAAGERAAEASHAQGFREAWGPGVGYRHTGATVWDDAAVPTRLGDAVEVVFVEEDSASGALRPYGEGEDWRAGRMRLRASQMARLASLAEDDERCAAARRAAPGARIVPGRRAARGGPLAGRGWELTRDLGLRWLDGADAGDSDGDLG